MYYSLYQILAELYVLRILDRILKKDLFPSLRCDKLWLKHTKTIRNHICQLFSVNDVSKKGKNSMMINTADTTTNCQ